MMLSYDAPPEHGVIRFEVLAAPVSLQASAMKKAGIVAAVRTLVAPCEYLLSGDVKLALTWHISERARYELDSAADVDNIVKPIVDALCGPGGIMIDDCQIQELTCHWMGGYADPTEERIEIELRFPPDEYQRKAGLLFLNVDKGLYFPIHEDAAPEVIRRMADSLVDRFRTARHLVAEGRLDLESAHQTLPFQRVFHKSKLGPFRTTLIEDLRLRFS